MKNKTNNKASKLIFKIFLALILGGALGQILILNHIGIFALRGLITFSDLFSQFLSFFVPIVVLSLVMPGIIELGGKASKMLITAIIICYSSMVFIGFVSMMFGFSFIPTFFSSIAAIEITSGFVHYEGFLPKLLTPFFDVVGAIVLAFSFGIAASSLKTNTFKHLAREIEACVYKILNSFVIPILPFYIGCIFAKLSAGGELFSNLQNFAFVIIGIFIIANTYMLLILFVGSLLTKRNFFTVIKAYIPAYFVAFGTQSSKATIPVTLLSAEKLNVSKEVREFGIPLLSTINLTGSMVTQIFGAIAIYYVFTGKLIDLSLISSYIFIVATILLAAPGIPGGEPVATKPLLTSFLGFPPGIAEIMFTLGIANDSFATSVNVGGDGGIILILDRLYKKWFN